MNVSVRTVPIYLGHVEAALRRLEAEPNYACLRREAGRIDRTFHLRPPLDPETRADIALYEWEREGRRATPDMARRAKQAILQVAAYAVIHGLADSWVGAHGLAGQGLPRPKAQGPRPASVSASATVLAG